MIHDCLSSYVPTIDNPVHNHHTRIIHDGRAFDLPIVVTSAVDGESVITRRAQVFSLVMEVWMICYTEKKIEQD
jgi:stress-induced morphogen